MSTFARSNEFGFIETPYRKVTNGRVTDHFFSCRGRHTRWNCDWSSDVCSSDRHVQGVGAEGRLEGAGPDGDALHVGPAAGKGVGEEGAGKAFGPSCGGLHKVHASQAGRDAHGRSEERRVGKERRARSVPHAEED